MPLKATLSAALLLVSAAAASADMGVLTPLLPPAGTDGAWTTATAGGAFAIANAGEQGAVRYYYLNTGPGLDKAASVTVDLADGAPDGFGGIIFNFDDAARTYHIFAAHNDGAFSIFRRGADGFSKPISTSLDTLAPGPLTLSIEERGDAVAYAVNGIELGAIGRAGIAEGGIGIAIGGIVSATFSGFTLADTSN